MNAHSQPSLEATLRAAHKARRAKWAALARKVKANDNTPVAVTVEQEPIPAWSVVDLKFDAHVIAYKMSLTHTACRLHVHVSKRCNDFGLSFADVTGESRKRHLILPRQIIQWELLNMDPKPTLRQIGTIFSDRDHATILSASRKIQAMKDAGDL